MANVLQSVQYQVSWIEAPEIQPQDMDKTCKQVYVWIVTKDKRVVIVSKDGKQWQLPGGKPESDETLIQTAVREVHEETGLRIGNLTDSLRFFGYQTVKEVAAPEPQYLQVRYLLQLDTEARSLVLETQNESNHQPETEVVRFIKTESFTELIVRIPWLKGSPEFTAIKSQAIG